MKRIKRKKEEMIYDILCASRIVDPVSRLARRSNTHVYMIRKLEKDGYLKTFIGKATHSHKTSRLVRLTDKGEKYILNFGKKIRKEEHEPRSNV